MRNILCIVFLLIFTPAIFAQQTVQVTSQKLSENVYMLKGRGGNIGISIGEDGVLVIDDQYDNMVPRIKKAITDLTDQEIRYIVNTHYHGDHTGGNYIFGKEGKTIVAHDNVYKRLSTTQRSEFWDRVTAAKPPESYPEITFDKSIKFRINQDTIHLRHFESAHTDGDVIVFFKKDNIIHMGDVFVTSGFPYVDADAGGSLNGFISTLSDVLEFIDAETKVIPGHGNLSTRNDVEIFRDKLIEIRDILLNSIRNGYDLDQTIDQRPLKKFGEEWGNSWIKPDDFIRLVFPGLKSEYATK